MYTFLLISLFLQFSPEILAQETDRDCTRLLLDVNPDFEPDLRLVAKDQVAHFRGKSIRFTPQEYHLLQLILLAPSETLSYAEILRELWGDHAPAHPDVNISTRIKPIRLKLAAAGSDFDKIKNLAHQGYYWSRINHAREKIGRVAVAKYIYQGYADGIPIALNRTEWRLLSLLIHSQAATAESFGSPTANCFSAVASYLNAKFKKRLGMPLVRSGRRGKREIILNPDLDPNAPEDLAPRPSQSPIPH